MIHMVWMMCFKEAHQSVNLKENSRGRYLPLFKTNQRERRREGDSKQSKISSSQRWRGWFRGGLRRSLTVEPAFIRYIILLQLHTFIDILSSASHQSLAVMPVYSVSNKINTYTLVCVRKHSDSKLTVPTVCKAYAQFNILFNV